MYYLKCKMRLKLIALIFACCLLVGAHCSNRKKRTLVYPATTLLGVFLAIAVPVDIPNKNVFVSYNFEANYNTPYNSTQYGELDPLASSVISSRSSRSISRKMAYEMLEQKFESGGADGRGCLLRSICDASDASLAHDGLLGQILHLVFTPSTTKDENLPSIFYDAEQDGRDGNCEKYLKLCPKGLLDTISMIIS